MKLGLFSHAATAFWLGDTLTTIARTRSRWTHGQVNDLENMLSLTTKDLHNIDCELGEFTVY